MTVYTAAITLFLVLDPLGNIPVFLSVLSDLEEKKRRRIILREMIVALVILSAFLFFGKFILSGMHISPPALSISGGVVLFLIAVRMIFPARIVDPAEGREEEPLIVPLAVPLVAGPSAMATLILFATQEPDRMGEWFLSLLIAWSAAAIVLVSSDFLRRTLGPRALRAIERLMGMILITMAVQMLLTGIEMFLGHMV
jgi:multiple antibiotic resistance protein